MIFALPRAQACWPHLMNAKVMGGSSIQKLKIVKTSFER